MHAMTADLKFHPLAEILPLLEGDAFEQFCADIAEHGLQNPIMLFEGEILDGRNRYRACRAEGVKLRTVEFTGDRKAAAAYVLSQNVHRRHLDPSVRAIVAARMANLKWGQRADRVEGSLDLSTAAKLVNVSVPTVKRAKAVLEHGTPELQQAVEQGRVTVREAEGAARCSPEAQADFLANAAAGKHFTVWQWNNRRQEQAARLAESARALPADKKRWPIILADPPWKYPGGPISTPERDAENHYPTMDLEKIVALPVADLATDDAILFLWATVPLLPQALQVIEAWGFKYRTGMVWDKEINGAGWWVFNRHEHLLVAVRGNPPKPPTTALPCSVIRERKREHSRKPEASYATIERMYPTLPKLELFARQARQGWSVWGNETDKFSEAS
jgi:N6-adenosine-specific RNA methylase IME4/ParB-like chromosome segregation protein Spo0J